MTLGTKDIPAIERMIGQTEGREKWLLQVTRLNVLMPDGVPIAVMAQDWGISEEAALDRLEEINTLGPENMVGDES